MRHPTPRAGQTLLELLAAASILALTLVPALRLMRSALEQADRSETLELATTYCISKLEEGLAVAGGVWQTGALSGSCAADGYPQLKWQLTRSDAAASGGIPARLLAIIATVWDDVDGDSVLDAGEPQVVLASKVADMRILQDLAGS